MPKASFTRWNLCATALLNKFQQVLHQVIWLVSWNVFELPLREKYSYATLPKPITNRKNNKFRQVSTFYVPRCNACWNLFLSAVAHKFQLKVSTCNSGLRLLQTFAGPHWPFFLFVKKMKVCQSIRSNKFLLKHLVIKRSDKKYERRFDRSSVIFKLMFMK